MNKAKFSPGENFQLYGILLFLSISNLEFPGKIINPWHMCEGYGSRFVCVSMCECVYIYYHSSWYIPRLYVESNVLLSFLCHSLHIYCVDFVESVFFFRSSGDID